MTVDPNVQPTPVPAPPPFVPPLPAPLPIPPVEPQITLQEQIGLLVAAVVMVVSFVFHKDYSALVPAFTTIAFSVVAAAVTIAHSIRHKSYVAALQQFNRVALDRHVVQNGAEEYLTHPVAQNAFNRIAADMNSLLARIEALEPKRRTRKPAAPAEPGKVDGRSKAAREAKANSGRQVTRQSR